MNTLKRTGFLALTLLAIANQVAHAEEPAAAAAQPAVAPAADTTAGYPVHGFLKSRYKARWTSDASDQDVYETLSLDVGDADRNRVTAHFLGDVSVDIDGNTSNHGNYPYDSARDSSGSNLVPLVYSCYLDVHRVGPLSLRAGRQSIYETPEISFFDGLLVESEELGSGRLKLGAYGGAPVHLYKGYTPNDAIEGAYVQSHLWQGARARVDWQHLEGRNDTVVYRNTLVGVGGWQSVGRYVDLHAHYTRLDDADRDVLLRGTFNQPNWDLRVQTSYYQQLQARQDTVIESDAYYPILKDYQPYREYRTMVSKGLGDHVSVDAGLDLRRLTHTDQESTFNHQYDRYYGTLDLLDLGVKGSSVSLTEEVWASPGRRSESQGVDITCPLGAKNKVSVGTDHYLYKYDFSSDAERADVQDYYVKYEYKHSRALRLRVNYSYEDEGSSGRYNELRCEAICNF